MIKPYYTDGVLYTPSMIDSLKQPVIDIRNCMLEQGQFDYAVAMSHVVLLLNHLQQNTENETLPKT